MASPLSIRPLSAAYLTALYSGTRALLIPSLLVFPSVSFLYRMYLLNISTLRSLMNNVPILILSFRNFPNFFMFRSAL